MGAVKRYLHKKIVFRGIVFLAFLFGAESASSLAYLGCWKDQGDPGGTAGRDISGLRIDDNAMTNDRCIAECQSRGFAYAATQYSSSCFCGNTYGRFGPATNCDMPCSGDAKFMCGGRWANSVYQLQQSVAPTVSSAISSYSVVAQSAGAVTFDVTYFYTGERGPKATIKIQTEGSTVQNSDPAYVYPGHGVIRVTVAMAPATQQVFTSQSLIVTMWAYTDSAPQSYRIEDRLAINRLPFHKQWSTGMGSIR